MAGKLGSQRRRPKTAPASDRKVNAQDNMSPEERRKATEDAEAIALISVLAKLKEVDPQIAVKAAELKTLKDARRNILGKAKLEHDFLAKEIEAVLADSKVGSRKNVTEAEARRYRWRRAIGLPVGLSDQDRELEARLPDVEKDAIFWRGAGYTAGTTSKRSEDLDPPTACVAAGHVAAWSEGVKDGQTILALALTPKKAAPRPTAPAPEPSLAEQQAEDKKAEARAKASLEAMKPTPEEVEGVISDMFDADGSRPKLALLKAMAAIRPDNADLAHQVETREAAGETADPADIERFAKELAGDDGFEATEAELAAQTTRAAVVDAKAGATTGATDEEAV